MDLAYLSSFWGNDLKSGKQHYGLQDNLSVGGGKTSTQLVIRPGISVIPGVGLMANSGETAPV